MLQVVKAHCDAERATIFHLRYRVYVSEMGKPYPRADHEQQHLFDRLDDQASLLYATDGDGVAGTVRINWGTDTAAIDAYPNQEALQPFRRLPANLLSFTSRLVVARGHRRYSGCAVRLFRAAYAEGRRRRAQFDFCTASQQVMPFFVRLGYRLIGDPCHDPDSGTSLYPLVLVIEDVDHLAACRSLLLRDAQRHPNSPASARWFSAHAANLLLDQVS